MQGGTQAARSADRRTSSAEELRLRGHGRHRARALAVVGEFVAPALLGGEASAVPRDADSFRHDAYVSYADRGPDADWVWGTLVPRLEAAGLRVAVSGDSGDPGVPTVVNAERGVVQAKRTVVVLSAAYLADRAAGFETVLAQTLGIQEGSWRVLPVRIGPLAEERLPLRLGMLTTLDLVSPYRSERGFARLAEALRGPLPRR